MNEHHLFFLAFHPKALKIYLVQAGLLAYPISDRLPIGQNWGQTVACSSLILIPMESGLQLRGQLPLLTEFPFNLDRNGSKTKTDQK